LNVEKLKRLNSFAYDLFPKVRGCLCRIQIDIGKAEDMITEHITVLVLGLSVLLVFSFLISLFFSGNRKISFWIDSAWFGGGFGITSKHGQHKRQQSRTGKPFQAKLENKARTYNSNAGIYTACHQCGQTVRRDRLRKHISERCTRRL